MAPNNVVAFVTLLTPFNPLKFSENLDKEVAKLGKSSTNSSRSVKFKNFSNTLASGTAFATTAMARRETADIKIARLFIPFTILEYTLSATPNGIKLKVKEFKSVIPIFFSRSPSSGTALAAIPRASNDPAEFRIASLSNVLAIGPYAAKPRANGIKLLAKESKSVIPIFFSRRPSSGTAFAAMARAFKANADLIIGSTWRFFATTP